MHVFTPPQHLLFRSSQRIRLCHPRRNDASNTFVYAHNGATSVTKAPKVSEQYMHYNKHSILKDDSEGVASDLLVMFDPDGKDMQTSITVGRHMSCC